MISYCSRMSSNFRSRGELIFPTSNLDVAYTVGYLNSKSANLSSSFCVL